MDACTDCVGPFAPSPQDGQKRKLSTRRPCAIFCATIGNKPKSRINSVIYRTASNLENPLARPWIKHIQDCEPSAIEVAGFSYASLNCRDISGVLHDEPPRPYSRCACKK